MLKKIIFIVSLSILCQLSTAQACSCPEQSTAEDALSKSSLVFVGQVKSKKVQPLKQNELEVKFKVFKKIKGFEEVTGDTVVVYTSVDFEYCGYKFTTGMDYLVYADGNPAHFVTSSCSRTNFLEKSQAEVQKLQKAAAPSATPAAK